MAQENIDSTVKQLVEIVNQVQANIDAIEDPQERIVRRCLFMWTLSMTDKGIEISEQELKDEYQRLQKMVEKRFGWLNR